MYLLCIKRLKDAGVTIVTDLGDAAPSGPAAPREVGGPADAASKLRSATGRDTMGRRMEQLMPLVSLPVADSVLGYVGATVTNSMRLLARDTPLSIDRVQGARLYGGMLEVRMNDVLKRYLKQGDGFGELALLYNSPRSATIKAIEDSLIWGIDRATFQKVVQETIIKEYSINRRFIAAVDVFSNCAFFLYF